MIDEEFNLRLYNIIYIKFRLLSLYKCTIYCM